MLNNIHIVLQNVSINGVNLDKNETFVCSTKQDGKYICKRLPSQTPFTTSVRDMNDAIYTQKITRLRT